jgi:mannose-6-phosphate isomerase-like protein (cupin superfamily)
MDRPFVASVSGLAARNRAFRRVLHTGPATQLVAMRLRPGESIGAETHRATEQTFLVLAGRAALVTGPAGRTARRALKPGDLAMVHPGTRHDVRNASAREDLVLLTWYAPPHHRPGTVHRTQADAARDRSDEEFGRRAEAAAARRVPQRRTR